MASYNQKYAYLQHQIHLHLVGGGTNGQCIQAEMPLLASNDIQQSQTLLMIVVTSLQQLNKQMIFLILLV